MTELIAAPLESLDISPLNPRRQPPPEARVAAMAASIRSVGLLTPLIGHEAEGGRYGIVGGGIRLRALQRLAEEDPAGFGPDWPVPLSVIAEPAARVAGAAEQAARAPLDPVDEFEAYHQVERDGGTVDAIAAAFAVTPRYVEQRLALAALPGPALEALRAGEIPLYVAEALAGAGKKAAALWKEFATEARSNPRYVQNQIRNRLRYLDTHSRELRHLERVGREAFEAEGGRVEEDLFGERVRLVNPDALERAMKNRLDREAERIARAAGFGHWVIGYPRDIDGAARIHEPRVELDEAEAARLRELEHLYEEEPFEDDSAEMREFVALEEKQETWIWTDDQKRLGSLCIAEDYSGEIRDLGVVIEAERIAEAVEAGLIEAPAEDERERDVEAAAETGWPSALIEDLARIPADIARDQLLDKPDLALTLLAHAFVCRAYDRPLDLAYQKSLRSGYIADDVAIAGWEAEPATDPVALEAFLERGAKHRNRVLAGVVAATLKPAHAKALGGLLDLDIRAHWTPDAAFFGRLKKPQLMEIGAELGAASAWTGTMKKAELVEGLAAIFADPPAEIAETVNAWLPPSLRTETKA